MVDYDVDLAETLMRGTGSSGWIVHSLSPWRSLPEAKSEIHERPGAHGAFRPRRVLRRALTMTLVASYLGATEAEALAAGDELLSALEPALVEVGVTDALGRTWRRVEVRASPLPETHGTSILENVTIDLIAHDIRRYGPRTCVSTGLPTAGTGLQFPLGGPGGTPLEVSRNIATNPLAAAATPGITSNSAPAMPVTRGVALPTPTPDGLTTGARITRTATTPSVYAVSSYNLDGLANVRVSCSVGAWVMVTEDGYRASISNSTTPAGVALAAGVWTWVTSTATIPSNVHLALVVTRISGANASTTVETYVTGVTTLPGAVPPTFAIAPGSTGLGRRRTVAWAGAANASEVILLEAPRVPFFNWGTPGSPGRVVVENSGTAATVPELSVQGPIPGFEIVEVETGVTLRFIREVLEGSTITLAGGRAIVDGASDVSGYLIADRWPSVPKKSVRTYQLLALGSATGSPLLTACSSPAY